MHFSITSKFLLWHRKGQAMLILRRTAFLFTWMHTNPIFTNDCKQCWLVCVEIFSNISISNCVNYSFKSINTIRINIGSCQIEIPLHVKIVHYFWPILIAILKTFMEMKWKTRSKKIYFGLSVKCIPCRNLDVSLTQPVRPRQKSKLTMMKD